MKLVTFARRAGGPFEIGIVEHDAIAVLDPAHNAAFCSMMTLIDAGKAGLAAARAAFSSAERVELASAQLTAPLPRPRQMRDALSFETHLRQARANRHLFGQASARIAPEEVVVPEVWYRQPIYYKCNRFAVSGPGDTIRWPAGETRLDYELELGIVLGRGGRDIPEAAAAEHVFGYLIFNDFSARDLQLAEMQAGLGPAKGKDFDSANALGPWLVTADELGNPSDLTMVARVNGAEWSRGNSGDMHHPFSSIIAHISRDETLHPGEFLGSGTVSGGCGLEHGRFLAPGDNVELEIDGLGRLSNTVLGNRTGAAMSR